MDGPPAPAAPGTARDPGPGPDALVTSILDCVAQPVWVVDRGGLIRFANPSALAALGYRDLAQLRGKPSHETIHYKRPDGSPFPVDQCPMLLPHTTGETVHRADDWFVRQDGSMFPVEYWSAPIQTPDGRGAVVAFADVSERRQAESTLRERDAALAALAERQRLARELHDSVSQSLFSMTMHARAAQLAMGRAAVDPGSPLSRSVGQLAELARGALAEMRALIFELRPAALAEEGLVAAVSRQAAALAAREGLAVRVNGPQQRLGLDPATEEHLYRIVLEALNNTVKHAGAASATVTVTAGEDAVRVIAADDGAGFDPSQRRPGHLGLDTMAERAAAAGAELTVSSRPGGGTTVTVRLPRAGAR